MKIYQLVENITNDNTAGSKAVIDIIEVANIKTFFFIFDIGVIMFTLYNETVSVVKRFQKFFKKNLSSDKFFFGVEENL